MNPSLDQGTIIHGLRSEKYPSLPCYGIIINASCDLANEKISKVYYLIAVNARKWFHLEYPYGIVYKEKIARLKDNLKNACDKVKDGGLDYELLCSFTREEQAKVLSSLQLPKKEAEGILDKLDMLSVFCKKDMNDIERLDAISKDSKPVVEFLESIAQERTFHFFFLPKIAYEKECTCKNDGLIVDLQEIGSISFEDARIITSPGIDYYRLNELGAEEAYRQKKTYWLNDENDFVIDCGKITSPWREHLMQRFSRDFSRIGLDGATKADYVALAKNVNGGLL